MKPQTACLLLEDGTRYAGRRVEALASKRPDELQVSVKVAAQ